MSWFQRKALPFDNNFRIHIETPPDPTDRHYVTFPIPYHYHAHLIAVGFDFFADVGFPIAGINWQCWVSRGHNRIYQWNPQQSPGTRATYNVTHMVALTTNASVFGVPFITERLPQHLYLYPHDVIHVQRTTGNAADKISNVRFTFRQWVTN